MMNEEEFNNEPVAVIQSSEEAIALPHAVDVTASQMRKLICTDNYKALEQLLKEKHSQDVLIEMRIPAVKFALDINKYESVRVLVEAGCNINATTDTCQSAYWNAVRYDKTNYMKLFLQHTSGEDLKQLQKEKYGDGNTLLHMAVRYASPRMVQLLLSYGFDPGVQNDYGETPLHLLDLQHSKAMANAFFNVKDAIKPDLSIRCNRGRTAEQSIMTKDVRDVLRRERRKNIIMRQKMSFRERQLELKKREARE